MPDQELKPESLLGGFHVTFDDTDLSELAGLSILSMAIPLGGDAALASAFSRAYGADMPPAGGSTLSSDGQIRFLWIAADQLLALFEDSNASVATDFNSSVETGLKKTLGGTAYVTLQSDSWVILRLSGKKARDALERICPIDLHPSAFPEGRVARTMMEHMGAIIVRESDCSFLLLSGSSMARSYLHAVRTSLQNVS